MEFYADKDADAFKTLQSLMKYNNGIFKSQKQANFIMSGALIDLWTKRDPAKKSTEEDIYLAKQEGGFIWEKDETAEEAYKRHLQEAEAFFNIKLEPGQHMISMNGYVRWADYGKSTRRVGFMYVMDDNGIVARYKLHYKYGAGGSSGVNRDRTELDWKRPSYAELPNYKSLDAAMQEKKAADEEAVKDQSFIGEVKQRMIFEGTVERVIDMGQGSYGYNSVYLKEWSIIKTAEGHTVVVHKNIGDVGTQVKFKATITEHTIYKGTKQTHVTRVAVL